MNEYNQMLIYRKFQKTLLLIMFKNIERINLKITQKDLNMMNLNNS